MPRIHHNLIVIPLILFPLVAAGCNGSSRRGLGGPMGDTGTTTIDTGTPMRDGGLSDSDVDVDSAIEEELPPTCTDGFIDCGGMCVDVDNDDYHCGGCDIVCGSGSYCDGGTCMEEGPTCPSPRLTCGESCVDTATNLSHCGSCFNACTGDQACRSGSCVSTCTPSCGGAECGSDGCGGTCGTCGSTERCVSGYCEPTAPPTGTGESCSSPRLLVTSASFTFSGRVANHTPFSCGASSSRPDVVYAYTAVSSGSVTITAEGSSGADTMLAVFSGSPCTSSYEVACNDDSPSGGLNSEVTFSATAFTTYYVVVAPYTATTPTDTITVAVTP